MDLHARREVAPTAKLGWAYSRSACAPDVVPDRPSNRDIFSGVFAPLMQQGRASSVLPDTVPDSADLHSGGAMSCM